MPTTDNPPLLDFSALRAMESDFQDVEPVRRFVTDFIEIWEDRCVRLVEASSGRNREAMAEILMGIKVSSVMLGALELRSVAEEIERHLRRGAVRVPENLLVKLQDCGSRTIRQLDNSYLHARSA